MTRIVRDIVIIDEDKCDGCGACVPACAEGALQVVDGKARLVSELYCDGLGACLGECPRGAIRVEKREAREFDEEAARKHVESSAGPKECPVVDTTRSRPAAASAGVARPAGGTGAQEEGWKGLPNWPIQLGLVSPSSSFLHGADLLLAADCTGYSYDGFRDLTAGRVVLVACPKLDDTHAHLSKLTAILSQSTVRSITVLRMEVPCCSGLVRLASEAVRQSGRDIPIDVLVVGIGGQLMDT